MGRDFPEHDRGSASTRLLGLTSRDVEDARRLLQLLADPTCGAAPLVGEQRVPMARDALIAAARRELLHRRLRRRSFPDGMFGEAAWEMLILLYAEQQGARFNVGNLARSLGLPQSSASRWLDFLHDRRFVDREPHPTDQRSTFVSLTAKAIEALDVYYSETFAGPE